ncbi:MAG: ribonuclease R [Flammeovirgaceae bacterium]|nr:ribonuclease R [Flammeovirgaceae bacterium]MBE63452.1 ribonuclease R [Flammeovirgaceae bacterium]MBR06170.1 ribonuclease R [Rickettsiales bacterium]HCX20426.1 ribonuclease R [Cytophagales bacterium]|tara:strand:- start:5248 stop:7416 length:2169 start_codon:yes stop_codon:yes gene_type:complete
MSKKRKKKKGGRPSKNTANAKLLKDRVRGVFAQHLGERFSYRQLIKKLGLRDKKSKEMLKDILFSMESNDKIKKAPDGRLVSAYDAPEVIGRVDHVNSRFAYIISPDSEEDIWVKSEDLNYAIDQDTVKVQITRPASDGFRPEGKVVELVERTKDEFVGRIEVSEKFSFVVPDNRNIHFDIMVYPEKIKKAKHNDKVIVKVTKWHDAKNRSPLGDVINVLGPAGENDAEIHSIMAEFGLPFQFPQNVEEAAEKIPVEISDEEISYRRDFRPITTFTIDPEDAKDFDDALSIEKMDNGDYEIGVHIADVSHYVKPKSILEKEALQRATSVYLVDRTIPMLPEKLSNGLCSLRPNEDKLTFSASFVMDTEGKVKKKWFGRTVIHSDRRFTYEEAQERIESGEGDFAEEIQLLNGIAHKLKDKRFKNGAVNFETTEVKFKLDEKGKPLAVIPKVRKDAHKMIEEFMLLANREVATHIYKWGRGENGKYTFVYRTHDDPDPEKLDSFAKFAAKFGHKMNTGGNISNSLNKLLGEVEGKPEQNVLEQLAIRSMAKAKYTTDPKPHFGLAFDHYTHFTSPIRRYPDVMVHRLLWHYLNEGKPVEVEPEEKKCVHSSEREKNAADAERASIKYKQVEFMQSMLGEDFEGIVSGVTEWGIFVEITETKCEGMVRLADLTDDFYEFDEKNYRIIGKRNKRIITLGDKLTVKVVKTDIDRRTIDLDLVELPE